MRGVSEELEIRQTADRGRGLFTRRFFPRGERILELQGWYASTDELEEDWLVIQVERDRWLCSAGNAADDCCNHSCEPNAGFLEGEPVLYALRDIAPGEEICWDYATSISIPEWEMECRCGSAHCRGTLRPWDELPEADRRRLRSIALNYLRGDREVVA